MDHFAGLDVSVKETNFCIVDDTSTAKRSPGLACGVSQRVVKDGRCHE
jgi:hypothetical protein